MEIFGAVVSYLVIFTFALLFLWSLIYNVIKPGEVKRIFWSDTIVPSILLFYLCPSLCVISFLTCILLNTRSILLVVLCLGLFLSSILAVLLKAASNATLFSINTLLLTLILSTYLFYPPSLGNDTWRDVAWAEAIDKDVSWPEISPYPLPIIPVLYLISSKIIGLSTVEASALIGLIYIELVVILVYVLSRILVRSTTSLSPMIILLITSNPLITLWSVHFIPQAYASVLSLFIVLFTVKEMRGGRSALVSTLLITLSLVFSHAAVSISTAFLLLCVLSGMRFLQKGEIPKVHCQYVKSTIKLLFMVFSVYVIFTTLIEVLVMSAKNILSVFSKVVMGVEPQRVSIVTAMENPLLTALLSYGSLVVCVVGAFFAWLDNKPSESIRATITEASFLFGLILLTVSMLGLVYNPELVLDRYLGLQALLILTILSVNGFDTLLRRNGAGKILILAIVILLAAATVYGGTFTPDQDFLNKSNVYAVHAPISWNEKTSIDSMVPYIKGLTAYTDWRVQTYVTWYSIKDNQVFAITRLGSPWRVILDFHDFTQLTLISLGTYHVRLTLLNDGIIGLTYTGITEKVNGLLIYRPYAFEGLKILSGKLNEQILYKNVYIHNKIYDGPIEAFIVG